MIDFSSGYSYAEILQQMLGQVDDRLDKREGSLIQTALGPGAWYLEGLALALQQIQGEAFVDSATGENLDYLAANRGLTRIAATSAVRQGTFDVPIPEGSTFKTINGADSVIFVSGDQLSASGSAYAYELTCETPGIIGNSYTGPILPVTAISGLTSATIGTVITPGAEEETDAALRVRYKASFGAAGYGGNITEYRQAILAIAGVGGVQIYPANQYQGGGTTLCAIIADDFTAASPALVQTVQETICPPNENGVGPSPNGYGVAPIGAAVTIQSATQHQRLSDDCLQRHHSQRPGALQRSDQRGDRRLHHQRGGVLGRSPGRAPGELSGDRLRGPDHLRHPGGRPGGGQRHGPHTERRLRRPDPHGDRCAAAGPGPRGGDAQ